MKTLLFILFAMMPGCWPCEPQTFDMGKIPGDVMDRLPYADGETMNLVHSAGHMIQFSIEQTIEDKEEISCNECCNTYLYEEVKTVFHPDHPVFDCQIRLNSMDTIIYMMNISIGRAFYQVPVADSMWTSVDIEDSMQIGNRFYHDVFRLKNLHDFGEANTSEATIQIDSLYFNFKEGILKITMTNDEYYQLVH